MSTRAVSLLLTALSTSQLGCFPDFGFGDGGGNGGEPSSSRASVGAGPGNGGSDGGNGGVPGPTSSSQGGAGDGGATSTTTMSGPSSSSSGMPPITVPCGDGNSVLEECAPMEACCFSLTAASLDHCGAAASCEDYVFECNEPSDCPGSVCCAHTDFLGFTGVIDCVASCDGERICGDVRDCQPGESCEQVFSDSFAPEYAPAYKYCVP